MLCFFLANAQNKPINLQPKDSVVYKEKYGLRAGVDLGRIVRSFVDERYTGFEIVGDYRLNQKLYLAAELGNEENSDTESIIDGTDIYDYTTSGSYIKLGVDYNTYENWYGMNNSVFIGGRLAFSSYNQTINSFNFFDSNRYWNPSLPVGSTEPQEFDGLAASWIEVVFGIKAELIANIYLGASVRLGVLVGTEEEQFNNVWIPGFNKVTNDSRFGVGYNYTLTYFLPLYKKAKQKKKVKKEGTDSD